DPIIGGIHAGAGRDALDQRVLRYADELTSYDAHGHAEPDRDAIDLVLHRAGVGIDIDAGGVRGFRHCPGMYSIGHEIARLATPPGLTTITLGKPGNKANLMTGPQIHRVSAYNTSKFSENKIHDDTVARKYGFSGGLVPGVDVLAYMLHMPVAKWGRAFLERGLIEARFVKPVYDGETAEVSAVAEADGLTIEVQSKGELCATGTACLPAAVPSFDLADYTAV